MRGWAPDGRETELSKRQADEVAALLIDDGGDHNMTVLHTVIRLDGIRRGIPTDDPVWDQLAARFRHAAGPAGALRLGQSFVEAP